MPPPSDPDPPSSPTPRPRVLLVDDEPALLAAYRRMLGQRFEVAVASGGRQALALLEHDSAFDAVFCDIMMPDLDGPAVWQHLETRHPELARRTAFCTAGAFTPRAVTFAEAMGDRLFLKPVAVEEMIRFVERVGRRG